MGVNVKSVVNLFNKAGYRLASKTAGSVVANMPAGAVSKTTVVIEHVSGKVKTVEQYLDKYGKAVKINESCKETGECFSSVYNWHRSPKTATNAFDSVTLEARFSGMKNGSSILGCCNVDVDSSQKYFQIVESVSKKSGTETNGVREVLTRLVDSERSIYREVSKRTTNIVNGSSSRNLVETSGKGIPASEVDKITSYPYFETMFFDKKELCRRSVDIACQRQGVSPMKLEFQTVAEADRRGGWCSYHTNTMAVTNNGLKGDKKYLFNLLEHEARHKWQHDLVEKMKRGELTHPQEIELAQKFEKEFAKYISIEEDFDGYYKQLVEVDAREAGSKAASAYKEVKQLIDRRFQDATDWSFISEG